jgi:PAS domain S-box-containing protein
MKDEQKTREQLIDELLELRRRVVELEASEIELKRTEEALRKSEAILNETGRIARIGGWEHDLITGQATWTRPLYDIIELESEVPPGPNEHLDYYPPQDRAILAVAYQRAIETGEPFDLELQCHTAKERLFWARAIGQPVFHEGKCVRMVGTFQDITERKRAEEALIRDLEERLATEEALRESEEQFRQLAESIREVFYMNDTEKTRMIYVSPAYEEIWGRTCESLYEQPLSFVEAIHPEDRERVIASFEKQRQGMPIEVEYRIVRPDGEVRWIWSRAFPVLDERGEFCRVAGIAEDITDRKRAEESLRESEASYRELAGSIADIFFAMDEELRYTYWNKASEELTSIPAKDAIGKSLWELFPDTPQTRKAGKIYLHVLRTQQPQSFVNEYQLGGEDFIFEINAYPSRNGLSVFVKDITERKRAEEERERLIAELQAALAKVKTLSGLLPICASCKKIRDDKGYWHQVEVYVRNHSEAQFSHGLCPKCMKKLYPEYCENNS